MAILTPWPASLRTVASPRPEAPPVTIAEMVLSSFMVVAGPSSMSWQAV
jgi:hypothetical protein